MANRDLPLISPAVFKLSLAGLAGLLFALVSACGGGGPSEPACRTGTPTEPLTPSPAASLTMKVDSYEGTGSPQCVRGVGFLPVVVIIKGDTDDWAVWRSTSMEGDSTADFATGQPNFEGGITSLDPDAFSLGEKPSVNAEGVTYYYVAFADSPDIKVGSYFGDGTNGRSETGVGFQPALVLVKRDGGTAARSRSAVWRSIAQPEGVSSFFDRHGDGTNFIRAFEADGFQVDSDGFVNADNALYHYVAFPEVPGRLETGSYVGDGSDNRYITGVGFQPDYVWIKRSPGESLAVHRTSSLSGDATLRFEQLLNGANEIKALQPDGFQIGSAPSVNFDGDTYYYVAWKASSGP